MYSEEEAEAVRQYVLTMPEGLHEHAEDFVQLKMSVAEVEAVICTARRAGHEWWVSAIDTKVAEQLEAAIGKGRMRTGITPGREHVTTIRAALSDADKTALRSEYAGVTDLAFQPAGRGEPVEHALANAARTIASVQLRRMIPKGVHVTEVGAKAEHAVLFGGNEGTYYGVMPILDAHDVQRHSQAVHNVKLMLKRGGPAKLKDNQRAVAETYLDRFETMFTRDKIQEVQRRTDIIISVDANYDIPMRDMPVVMNRLGARMWIGNMTRCEEAASVISGKRSGHIRLMGFDYCADAAKDRVLFTFRSGSRPYIHKLSVYREYMYGASRTYHVGDAQYVYTILPQTVPSQIYYSMVRVGGRPYVDSPISYVPTGDEGMIRISAAEADWSTVGGTVKEGVFDVPEDIFTRVLQDRMLAGSKQPMHEVYRQVRSARIGIVVNGVRVSSEMQLATPLVRRLATVVDVLAERMLKDGEVAAKGIRDNVRVGGRRYMGLFEAVADRAWSMVAGPGTLVGLVRDRLAAAVVSDLPGVSIERLPAFRAVNTSPVRLNTEGPEAAVALCLCQERAEAEAMVRGDRGGLSFDELTVLQQYLERLKHQECPTCEFDATRVTEAYEECVVGANPLKDEEEAAAAASSSDSGYVSDDEKETWEDASETGASGGLKEDLTRGYGQQTMIRASGPVRDSIDEYVDIMERQMEAQDSEAKKWAGVCLMGGVNARTLEFSGDGRTTHHVLKVEAGVVVGIIGPGADPQGFKRVYDFNTDRYYDVSVAPNGQCFLPVTCSSQVYTNSGYAIWNQPVLLSAARKVLASPFVGPLKHRVRFVNGIFGCGKTREITQAFKDGDAYLTATAASAGSVRKKLYADSPTGKRCIRTFDSGAMHGVDLKAGGTLYLDEVPMAHAGQVFMLLEMVKPQRVVAYGDYYQIKYISFLAAYVMRYSSLRPHCDVEMRRLTHRCRLSIVAGVLPFYGMDSGIGVCKCCAHIQETEEAVSLQRISSVNQVFVEPGVKYLFLKQKEALEMRTRMTAAGMTSGKGFLEPQTTAELSAGRGFLNPQTAHEVQGETFDRVAFIRTEARTKPGTIYFSVDHVVTAVTRARLELKCYTTSHEEDAMVRFCMGAASEHNRGIVRANSA